MHRRKQRKDGECDINVCAFCCEPSDEKKCGKFFTSQLGFSVHQYCMFFSAALPQNGKDDEGFEGFLEQDVLKEIRRAGRLRCGLCLKKGASAGCCDQNCKKGFHFTCGLKRKYLFQFYGQFRAFCFDHRLHQNSKSYPSKKAPCPICLESVPCRASPDVLTTPCCKDVWLHRSCVQEQATVSGYFFRCAVCNNKEKFVQEMKRMGVYVPDRDAAWEEGNNFAELLEKYSRCDNTPCICPMGRQFIADSGQWDMVLCSSCGQYGTHVGCKTWSTNPPSMLCPTCRPVHEPSVPTPKPLALSLVEPITKSPVTRKGRGRSRGRRSLTESSDTDSDDISAVLNGLKRQTEDDFLNSDTNFFVQRAIAAGNAMIEVSEHSRPKKCKTSQSASRTLGYNCNRKRKAEDTGRNASEESDDEILITKYVPGQKCEICPKCNRRKPINVPTSSPAKIPRKVSPTGGTSSVRRNTGSTCTITRANTKNKEAGNESAGFVTNRGNGDPEGAGVKVADYEVLELAAHHTDKSSVLLLSSEETTSEFEGTNLTKNERDPQSDPPRKAANSFWTRFLGERCVQYLKTRYSPDPLEENNNRKIIVLETSDFARQPSEVRRSSPKGSREVSESSRESENIRQSSERTRQVSESNNGMDKIVPSATSRKSGSPRKRTSAINRSSDEAVQDSTVHREATGEKSPSTEKSETTGERPLGKISSNGETNLTQPESNTTPSKFSNSFTNPSDERLCSRSGSGNSNKKTQFLTKKAVLEAVIEHTMELKNSGNELPQRCVSSC